jgi:hypothetical protein
MSDIEESGEKAEKVYEPIIADQHAAPPLTTTHSNTDGSQKEARDPNLDIDLPYRTLTSAANLNEYVVENPQGEIEGRLEPDGENRYKLVTFLPNDPENPKNWSKAYKWYCTMVVAITCFVVAFCSAVITADLGGVAQEFHVSREVSFLTITVFVVGFGVGEFLFPIFPGFMLTTQVL